MSSDDSEFTTYEKMNNFELFLVYKN